LTGSEEYTRERVPLDWAMIHTNLGCALQTLGERETGTARLEEAVAAHRAALEEYTREHTPLDWARAHNNLGTALTVLGERRNCTAQLEGAVDSLRCATEVFESAGADHFAIIARGHLERARSLVDLVL
jgi:hypothetical protein